MILKMIHKIVIIEVESIAVEDTTDMIATTETDLVRDPKIGTGKMISLKSVKYTKEPSLMFILMVDL